MIRSVRRSLGWLAGLAGTAALVAAALLVLDVMAVRDVLVDYRASAALSPARHGFAREAMALLVLADPRWVAPDEAKRFYETSREETRAALERAVSDDEGPWARSEGAGRWRDRHRDLERHLERAVGLVEAGQSGAGERLLGEALDVLVASWLGEALEGDLRQERVGLDRAFAEAAGQLGHWALLGGVSPAALDASRALVERAMATEQAAIQQLASLRFALRHAAAGEGSGGALRAEGPMAGVASPALGVAPDPLATAAADWRSAARVAPLPLSESGPADRLAEALAAMRARAVEDARGRERALAPIRAAEMRLLVLGGVLLVFAMGFALAVSTILVRGVVRPLGQVLDGVRELEAELGAPLPAGLRGEWGQVVGGLDRLRQRAMKAERRVRALAFYDATTGLVNRRHFLDRLRASLVSARVDGRTMAILSLAVEGLHGLEQSLGPEARDDLLRQVAERVNDSVRLNDVVARNDQASGSSVAQTSEGELTILLNQVSDAQDAAQVAERIVRSFAPPFRTHEQDFKLDVYLGIAISPGDGGDAETLLRNVQMATQHAANRGSSHYQFCSDAMNAAATRKLQIRRRLGQALEDRQLELHYQPIRDTRTGRVTGLEALLRWTDPELGPVPTGEFVAIAEESGLINAIGCWVVVQACTDLRAWQQQDLQPVRVSVNVSASQLRDVDFAQFVVSQVEAHGLSADQIEIEITESVVIEQDAATSATLAALHRAGFGLVLDDFGTGYSSFSHLQRFPIERVKIDRSFVAEITEKGEGAALASAILAFASSLGLPVVAEGVETRTQADFLTQQGCDELQGYLISQAVAPDQCGRFLDGHKPERDGDGLDD